jgi:hypothetical protein
MRAARMALDIQETIRGLLAAGDGAAIRQHPLSVQVRSGWHKPGTPLRAEEYEILICIGGPGVRIWGQLDDFHAPITAHLEHQDWGMGWSPLFAEETDEEALLTYAKHFSFIA